MGSSLLLSYACDAHFLSFLIHGPRVKMLGGGKGYLGDDFVVNFSPEFLQFELKATCNLMLVNFGFVLTHSLWCKCLIHKCNQFNQCNQVGAFWILFSSCVMCVRCSIAKKEIFAAFVPGLRIFYGTDIGMY